MTVAFPGLSCAMMLVVASIGYEGLLGTDALQSCLPHQLDIRMGQLWVDGLSTLQLHQQRQAAHASTHLTTSLVLPPDSEIVAPVSVRSPSGVRPGQCSLIEPCMTLTDDYGVLVGRTLVDASKWSANVLMVNPSSLGTRVSWDGSTPPGSAGRYCDRISSLLGVGGSDDTQEYIASVCSCVSGTRGACDGIDYVRTA